ncbi:hypothetical protein H6P81_010875 [Aristolochia fimbriata]|uniref:Small ribosomal subunit protein mS41 SAM domain-containing protein n=1 Tax=Aristolochia fimbriata TaxID=158543 RepID=A0AAV7ES39_ARIFI|nr:hypothetical protein H6P81_010875 [Aristolochia fimbriata]
MAMSVSASKQILSSKISLLPNFLPSFPAFSSRSNTYIVKVGIPEFLNGIGRGVEEHVEKLEKELGDLQNLLVTRTLKLKKLEIPCKHRKLILSYAHKYRLGLWRPQADLPKPSSARSS